METVTDFIFLGSKITADCDCSQEIKRRLLLGRKATANLDNRLVKFGKGVHQCYILSLSLFNLYAEYIMQNATLDEAQAGIKTLGEIPVTLDK